MSAMQEPEVGLWYTSDDNQVFKVVAYDEDDETVEVQFFDGSLEEFDLETWYGMELEVIESPEHGSGPFDDHENTDNVTELEIIDPSWNEAIDELD